MKISTIIVLMAVLLGIFVPYSLPVLALGGAELYIGDLDMCHSSTPSLNSGGDMPFLSTCPCKPLPATLIGSSSVDNTSFSQLLIVVRNERPPIA